MVVRKTNSATGEQAMLKRREQLRQILLDNEDGLTTNEIADLLETERKNVAAMVKSEYSIYIDRWVLGWGNKYYPVYCIQPRPDDCPKPELVVHESHIDGQKKLSIWTGK